MQEIFPDALVECIKSGKPPTREQIGSVAVHIWRDWCHGFGLPCDGMPRDPILTSYMRSLAWLALTGDTNQPPFYWCDTQHRELDGDRLLDVA